MLQSPAPRRFWLTDAACALAFFTLSFFATRATKGWGFVSLFMFVITAGAGYAFARSAWRGIMGGRDAAKKSRKIK